MTLNLCRDNISFEPYLTEYNSIELAKEKCQKRFVTVEIKDHFIHILGVHIHLIVNVFT